MRRMKKNQLVDMTNKGLWTLILSTTKTQFDKTNRNIVVVINNCKLARSYDTESFSLEAIFVCAHLQNTNMAYSRIHYFFIAICWMHFRKKNIWLCIHCLVKHSLAMNPWLSNSRIKFSIDTIHSLIIRANVSVSEVACVCVWLASVCVW